MASEPDRSIDAADRASFHVARAVFLRALGLVYGVAFASYAVQVQGLIGSDGILPAAQFLGQVRDALDDDSVARLPTLLWLRCDDATLQFGAWTGVALSAALVVGLAPKLTLALLWALYLSLVQVGQDFLGFQWDGLLLETGLCAVLFAPWTLWLHRATTPPTRASRWLLLWLLFRLMLASGLVKWGADPVWRDLTALDYHYWTQPLPGPAAHLVHNMAPWTRRASCAIALFIELVVPFFVLIPWRVTRRVAATLLIGLQVLITVTGNYGFFNVLTIALCLPLIDDGVWRRILPTNGARPRPRRRPGELLAIPPSLALAALGAVASWSWIDREVEWPAWIEAARERASPYRSLNGYGLFANMTEDRIEIEVQGSRDGREWKTYVFRYKPGPLERRPVECFPHMPRLDWQMWFAALGRFEQYPWFHAFEQRLLEGSRSVAGLLAEDPFADRPPRFVRALSYRYRFTTREELRRTGHYWTREPAGPYGPVVTLVAGRLVRAK